MNNGEIKLITSQTNAIHIIKLISSERSGNKEYSDVKDDLEPKLSSLKVQKNILLFLMHSKKNYM